MLCQVPVDYRVKKFSASLSVNSAVTLPDEIYISGVSNLNVTVDIVADCDAIKKPVNYLNVAICDLQINWQPSTTYRFRFRSDFVRDPENQPNPQFDVTYTTNPLPAIPSANPGFNTTDVTNNTTIRLNFDRKMRLGDPGNIYLYQVASPSNILLGTYSNQSNITLALDGASISFSTLGKLKANTQYYILSDALIYRDYDNFYLPQITSTSFYTFTTDQSTDEFPDLITIQFVTGDVAVQYIRYRNQFSDFDTVDSNLSVSDQYRLRRPPIQTQTVESSIVSAMTYNTGKLLPNLETSIFESVDNVLTYNKGGLAANLETDALLSLIYRRFRTYISNQDSNFNFTNNYIRTRPFQSTQSLNFDQTSIGDWGLLESTRTTETYSTNTTVDISGGPKLTDTKGPANPGYSLTITPSDPNAVSLLDVPWYSDNNISNYSSEYTTQPVALSGDGNTMAISDLGNETYAGSEYYIGSVKVYKKINGTWTLETTLNPSPAPTDPTYKFGHAIDLSYDGNTLVVGNPNGQFTPSFAPTARIYTRSGSTWTLRQTLTGVNNFTLYGWAVSISGDGNTVAVGERGYTSTIGRVYIYIKSGSTWVVQDNTTCVSTSTLNGSERNYPQRIKLSHNGNCLIVSDPQENRTVANDRKGVIYTYSRTGTTWSLDSKLFDDVALPVATTPPSSPNSAVTTRFGTNFDLSGDGNTLVVNRSYIGNIGAAVSPDRGTYYNVIVYTKSGSTWTLHTNYNFGVNEHNMMGYEGTQAISINYDGTKIIFFANRTTGEWGVWPANIYQTELYTPKLRLLEKISNVWNLTETTVLSTVNEGTAKRQLTFSVLDDSGVTLAGNRIIQQNPISTDLGIDQTTVYTYEGLKSWNATTKSLTLTGSKQSITGRIDLLRLTPTIGYTSNFILTYTATRTSDGFVSIRFQNVNRI